MMRYKKIYLIASLIILIPGIVSLFIFGLNLSVDFSGGSIFTYDISQIAQKENMEQHLKEVFRNSQVGVSDIVIRESLVEVRAYPVDSQKNDEVFLSLQTEYGEIKQKSFITIGPSIGKETTTNAFKALGVASLGIMLYIAYAFRNIPKPYSSLRFGASAIIAMLHDAALLIGLFSVLGKIAGVQVDALFITATLTVIGFSVHDSIVVFDRIRENLRKLPANLTFEQIVDFSIAETLNRSFATSLTVLITLLSLFILGGESIKYFVLALLVGILSGTYSSIFIASPILVLWEDYISSHKRKK